MRKLVRSAAQVQTQRRRCAIYTRKSSEEGLEQEFNSLDAQREACASYIASQRHEGWIALPARYDDGGISGGTMDRPALRQLLADIAAHKIDLVVVYKVDRLTRSLSDFAKIVDVFDAHQASFVSVTQQFNTTTSMGRLTLNMLLSFAQFEREVTGERIRDKIAASKRKGMWMGGAVPLGYDIRDRKLVINVDKAETVRKIFQTYLALGSVRRLQERLADEGVRSKQRSHVASTRMRGGRVIERGALYLLLQNRLYRGEIRHGEHVYPGQHEAIINPDLWDAVQQRLADNRVSEQRQERAASPSLLAGLVHDGEGSRLIPSHANKGGKRYRYYVSKALVGGASSAGKGIRIPAMELDRLVWARLSAFLCNRALLLGLLQDITQDARRQRDAVQGRATAPARLRISTVGSRRSDRIQARTPPSNSEGETPVAYPGRKHSQSVSAGTSSDPHRKPRRHNRQKSRDQNRNPHELGN